MASPLYDRNLDNAFSNLTKPEDPSQRERGIQEYNERLEQQDAKSRARTFDLLGSNETRPSTLSSITVLHANQTRQSFLRRVLGPILHEYGNEPRHLTGALGALSRSIHTLQKFDIYEIPISLYLDYADPTNPLSTPVDISAFISVREKSRVSLRTGASAGDNDGNITGDVLLRNLFGGAECFTAHASRGYFERSSYAATFQTPILSNPRFLFEMGAFARDRDKPWSSHEEISKGGMTRFRWESLSGRHSHAFGYEGWWRQVTGLSQNASASVRHDAGDSFKSSLSHEWVNSTRDDPIIPSRGYSLRSVTEMAGFGPLKGDVSFVKAELEGQSALPIPLPFFKGETGISFITSFRGGLLYPLSLGTGDQRKIAHSRLNDRFTLGGPTDVRGFYQGGLGPRDGVDAVGGDVYAAGGASLLFPFPRLGKDSPLRMQAFVNGGRLLGLQDPRSSETEKTSGDMSSADVRESVKNAIMGLGDGLPSTSAGVGVLYSFGNMRLEANFSLPLVTRAGEQARKGFSIGVGLSFL